MLRRFGLTIACLLVVACGGSGSAPSSAGVCPSDASLTLGDPACGNEQPIADAGDTSAVDAGEIVRLDARGSRDPDGSIVGYLWTQASGAPVTIGTPGSAIASFIAPRLPVMSDLVFRVQVTDNDDAMDDDRVTFRVNAATNLPPIADAGVDDVVSGGTTVVLDGRASSDPDIPLTDFLWEQVGGTTNVQISGDTEALAVFDAPMLPTAENLRFRLTVTGRLRRTERRRGQRHRAGVHVPQPVRGDIRAGRIRRRYRQQ